MPTYGYECLSCNHQFETFQSIKDDALTICDACGGSLRKRIYPVGIAFKGSGFYVNDYAPKSGGSSGATSDSAKTETPKADLGGEAKSEPNKTEPVKSEVKSEAKAEPKTPTPAP